MSERKKIDEMVVRHLVEGIKSRSNLPDELVVSEKRIVNLPVSKKTWRARISEIPILGSFIRSIYGKLKKSNIKRRVKDSISSYPLIFSLVRSVYAMLRVSKIRDELFELHLKQSHQIFLLQNEIVSLRKQLNVTIQEERKQFNITISGLQKEINKLQAINAHAATRSDQLSAPLKAGKENELSLLAAMDNFYVDFEKIYRGSEEAVTKKQNHYLAYLSNYPAGAKALDIGCGRGEWLDTLRNKSWSVTGVDLNALMIARSGEKALQVYLRDGISHLQSLQDESLDVITAFHVIEHLEFPSMLQLFSQAYRVLKPGGILIFETPNPENTEVSSYYFFMDPTHRNPVPPPLADFFAKHVGFSRTHIDRVGELGANDKTFDYALIAWK